MTLQQLEYVLAVADHGHFTKAAEACGITQSTLSAMLHKLEDELDLEIFDRSSHPVRPTVSGQAVVEQARTVVCEARKLMETTLNEGKRQTGTIRIAFAPTIAPYLVPQMIHELAHRPGLDFRASEVNRDNIIRQLLNGELDMGVCSIPHPVPGLLEIPLYQERLLLYVSETDPLFKEKVMNLDTLPFDRLWSIHNEYSFASDVFDNYAYQYARVARYSSGNIATLLHIVNLNDGFTILPELHLKMLRPEDVNKTRTMNPDVKRQVSIFVRQDYVREGLINLIVDTIKQMIPAEMLDSHIAQYPVRLR